MGFEKVATDNNGTDTYIDNDFRLTITNKIRVNINQACTALLNGEIPQAIAEWREYRLWNGAHFVGMFTDRDEVQKVVSQLRAKNMERKKR